jgi:hypothetical protein
VRQITPLPLLLLLFCCSSCVPAHHHCCVHNAGAGTWQQQQQQHHSSSLPALLKQQHHQALPQMLQWQPSLFQQQQAAAAHQLQQQRGVKQLRPYAEAPKLPPKFKRPDKDGRMNRMVIRIPPQVQIAVQDGNLILTGTRNSRDTFYCLALCIKKAPSDTMATVQFCPAPALYHGSDNSTSSFGFDLLLPCCAQLVPYVVCCAGKAGSNSVSLTTLDPSGLVAWRCLSQSTAGAAAGPGTGSLLLMCSPSKRHWRSIQTHINNAVHGVMQVGGCRCACVQGSWEQWCKLTDGPGFYLQSLL